MKNLRTIIVKRGYFSEGPKYLPSSLRILEWKRYPSQRIPSNFHPKNLAICKLPNSCLKSYGLASLLDKEFVNLKVLNFNRCKYLKYIPDVSGLNLEKISFESCHNLTTIHNSIGFLNNLKILNANFCTKLRSFPPLNLTSLEELELSNCYRLKNFPEILGEMKYTTDISLWKTSIKELPFSFQNLTGLKSLLIVGQGMFTSPSNILMMPRLLVSFARHFCLLPKQNDSSSSTVPSNLRQLYLSKCNLSDEFLTVVLSWFAKVTTLDLSGSNFTTLPECLRECCSLYTLRLNDCKCLQEIRGIPPNLKHLDASGCKSLTSSSRSLLLNQELHEAGDTDFCLPGSVRIPLWFEHQSTGMSISFWFRYNIPAAALIFVCESVDDECPNSVFHSLDVILTINSKMQRMKLDIHPIDGIKPDHIYIST